MVERVQSFMNTSSGLGGVGDDVDDDDANAPLRVDEAAIMQLLRGGPRAADAAEDDVDGEAASDEEDGGDEDEDGDADGNGGGVVDPHVSAAMAAMDSELRSAGVGRGTAFTRTRSLNCSPRADGHGIRTRCQGCTGGWRQGRSGGGRVLERAQGPGGA